MMPAARQPTRRPRNVWLLTRPRPRCQVGGPQLTANLTANRHDNRGLQRTALDRYIRPELRRCARR